MSNGALPSCVAYRTSFVKDWLTSPARRAPTPYDYPVGERSQRLTGVPTDPAPSQTMGTPTAKDDFRQRPPTSRPETNGAS